MNWNEFKTQMVENPGLHLQFEFAKNQKVSPSFHITEIKQANITAVDCGGKMNAWTEVILQLWEPNTSEIVRSMQVSKAMSIIDLVEKTLPLNPNSIVKVEFGNDLFETRQMLPQDFEINLARVAATYNLKKSTFCRIILQRELSNYDRSRLFA